jgi:hypothetical protein
MPVGDLLEARVFCVQGDQLAVNQLYYRVEIDTTGFGLQTLHVNEFSRIVGLAYKPLLASTAEYRGVIMRKIFPTPPDMPLQSTTEQGLGQSPGEALPRQVCGMITKRTAHSGRAYRGRVYVAFPSEADNASDTTPIPDYLVRLNALASALLGTPDLEPGAEGFNVIPVLMHAGDTIAFTRVTSAVVRDRWATQRRRGSYGAVNVSPV